MCLAYCEDSSKHKHLQQRHPECLCFFNVRKIPAAAVSPAGALSFSLFTHQLLPLLSRSQWEAATLAFQIVRSGQSHSPIFTATVKEAVGIYGVHSPDWETQCSDKPVTCSAKQIYRIKTLRLKLRFSDSKVLLLAQKERNKKNCSWWLVTNEETNSYHYFSQADGPGSFCLGKAQTGLSLM